MQSLTLVSGHIQIALGKMVKIAGEMVLARLVVTAITEQVQEAFEAEQAAQAVPEFDAEATEEVAE